MTDTTKPDACRELKPCPFCGHEAALVSDHPEDIFVSCTYCGVDGPLHETTERAVAAWNARAPVDASIDLGADLRAFLENLAKAGSEPLNSAVSYRDKDSRRHFMVEIRNTARSLLSHAAAQQSEDKRDTERLDWLDKMNSALNRHYGTVYRWKLILSPNIVRLMVGVQQRGFVGDLDLNDAQSGENSFTSCREAIDAARASTGEQDLQKGEGS